MNFALSEDQNAFSEALARIVSETCPVRRVHEVFNTQVGYDERLWDELKNFGATGLCVPAEFGGIGMDMLDAALMMEVLGRHAAPVPMLGHTLATLALSWSDNEQLKREWLPMLASGELIGSVAIGEGNGQWLPSGWKTGLNERGEVSGKKDFVPAAMDTDLIVVGLDTGELGIVLTRDKGVERSERDGVDRTRPVGALELTEAPIQLLGSAAQASRLLDAALVLIAADSFGGAGKLLEMSVAYAAEREQYGVKIGSFQALKHQLANMVLEIEPCRGFYWYAAYAFDYRQDESSANASLCKSHLVERYMQAARDAVEAHGGIGFTWEYDVQLWFKRAMFNLAWGGSPALHRERYATLMGW